MRHLEDKDAATKDAATKGGKIHPAFWIVLFFAVLFALEASFFVIASTQPDDRIPAAAVGQGS